MARNRSRGLPRRLLGLALAGLVAACQTTVSPSPAPSSAPSYDVVEPGVVVGPERTCDQLQLSDIRCTILQLRAAADLEAERPGHADVATRTLHAEGDPPAGTTRPPRTTTIPVIVVFTLQDGTRIAVPTHCPRDGAADDQGCDPRVR